MTKLKIQLVLILSLLLLTTARGAEPNNPAANLIFELKPFKEPVSLPVSNQANAPYVGSLIVKMDNRTHWTLDEIMSTPTGKTLSDDQKKLMFTADCIQETPMNPEAHRGMICLFGVSEKDVKKLTLALMEAADDKAQKTRTFLLSAQTKLKEEITSKEDSLSKIEKKAENLNRFEPSLLDVNLVRFREGIIFDTTKLINQFNIEMAGLQAKLKEIDFQVDKTKHRDANQASSEGIVASLEKMRTEFIIELNGLEAKKDAAEQILRRENGTINMCREKEQLEKDLEQIREELINKKRNLENVESRIKGPFPEAEPLEVFQNKVMIYALK